MLSLSYGTGELQQRNRFKLNIDGKGDKFKFAIFFYRIRLNLNAINSIEVKHPSWSPMDNMSKDLQFRWSHDDLTKNLSKIILRVYFRWKLWGHAASVCTLGLVSVTLNGNIVLVKQNSQQRPAVNDFVYFFVVFSLALF